MASSQSVTDPFAIARTSKEVLLCFFGLYCWEYCISLWFEGRVARRKYRLKWPLVPYFLARYSGLASLIANMVFVYPHRELDCQALQTSMVVLGNIGITAASGNLMVRAILVWDYKRWVIATLSLLFVGQWVLVFVGLRVGNVKWNRIIGACVPTDSRAEYVVLLGAFSIYTAGFDSIVAILTVLGVRKFERGDLATLLRHQGIGYFGLILAVHTVTVALVFYDLNSFLGIYGGLAAVVFSPIVSCRLVRAVREAPSQSRRGTTTTSAPSSWDTSRSSRTAHQETGVQLTTRVEFSQSETDEFHEMQSPIEKRSHRPGSSICGGTIASNV